MGMETKKLGFLILGMSLVLGFVMFNFMGSLNVQGQQLHCNPTQECQQISSVLGVSHIAIGLLSFIFALGFYLLLFNKDEKEIIRKYYEELQNTHANNKTTNDNLINNQNNSISNSINNYDNNPRNANDDLNNNKNIINNDLTNSRNNIKNNDDKFSTLLRPLDDNQKKVLIAIKEQEGITQSTLRFRADLSKAKISQILTDFEKKNLIERKAKGKTYSVFLAEQF